MGRASLLVVLGFLVVFGTIKANINKTVLSLSSNLVSSYEETSARDAATSSIYVALKKVSKDNDLRGSMTVIPFLNSSALVTISDSTVDAALHKNELKIVSVATVGKTTRTTKALAKRESLIPQKTEAAIGLKGAVTDLGFLGAAFFIDGHDRLPGGAYATPRDSVAGISAGSPADSARIVTALHGHENQVQGAGPEPSVATLKASYDFARLFEGFRQCATRTLVGNQNIGGGPVWGTRAAPEVTIVSGTIKVTGGLSGVGILAVDGSLTLVGNVSWEGLILVKSAGNLKVQGNPTIYGALLCEAGPSGMGFTSGGSLSLYYSSSALETARSKLDINYFRPYAWYE